MRRLSLRLFVALLVVALPLAAQDDVSLPAPLRDVGFDQRLGEQVPFDLALTDPGGAQVRLGDLIDRKPVVLALVYYDCPMLCGMVLDGLTRTLRALGFVPGEEFTILTVSFDPRETPELAAQKRDLYLRRYGRPEAADGWHFLTGDADAIEQLTGAVGFRYALDPESGEFAHVSGLVVLTPEGRVARYFFGVEYPARYLRLALIEAAEEKIGNLVDQVLLYCFQYDPSIGKYSAVVMNIVRLGGVATVALIGLFLFVSWRRERRARGANEHLA